MSFSSANCRDWAGMRLRFLPLSRICLTVASTFISKRSSSCFLTRKQTIFVCSCHDSDPFHLCSVGRDNISFRLNSGRKQYVEKGGKLGRPTGSTKSQDKKREEYREVINLLNKGYAIRDVAKLTGKGISTVQRVKKEFVV